MSPSSASTQCGAWGKQYKEASAQYFPISRRLKFWLVDLQLLELPLVVPGKQLPQLQTATHGSPAVSMFAFNCSAPPLSVSASENTLAFLARERQSRSKLDEVPSGYQRSKTGGERHGRCRKACNR
jgi:hypothetical protein